MGAALAALGVACALFTACSKSADNTPTPLVTVQAEHPKLGTIAEHIAADALLTPLAQAAIAPKISAPVRRFFVPGGASMRLSL